MKEKVSETEVQTEVERSCRILNDAAYRWDHTEMVQRAAKPCLNQGRLYIQYISITQLKVNLIWLVLRLLSPHVAPQWLDTEPMLC